MDKKDYISGNLYKMTRNNADFNPQTNAAADVSAPSRTISSAQQRRLTDVYNAKLDLMGRMERSAKKLAMLNDELESIIEKRKKASLSLQESLEKIKNLTEPDGGRELQSPSQTPPVPRANSAALNTAATSTSRRITIPDQNSEYCARHHPGKPL